MPIILGTQAEIRRIAVQSQPRLLFLRPYLEKIHYKKRAGSVGSQFRSQYHKKICDKEGLFPKSHSSVLLPGLS
jgi:hypothetical protein